MSASLMSSGGLGGGVRRGVPGDGVARAGLRVAGRQSGHGVRERCALRLVGLHLLLGLGQRVVAGVDLVTLEVTPRQQKLLQLGGADGLGGRGSGPRGRRRGVVRLPGRAGILRPSTTPGAEGEQEQARGDRRARARPRRSLHERIMRGLLDERQETRGHPWKRSVGVGSVERVRRPRSHVTGRSVPAAGRRGRGPAVVRPPRPRGRAGDRCGRGSGCADRASPSATARPPGWWPSR